MLRLKIESYNITVNYDISVEDAIKAGDYDWDWISLVHRGFKEESFPTEREGIATIKACFVCFRSKISTEQAEQEIQKLSFRNGTMQELLAAGAVNRRLGWRYPVVSLDKFPSDHPRDPNGVLILSSDMNERFVSCASKLSGRKWPRYYRFLAVSK